MSQWWRAYNEAVDDPKLIGLTDEQHRFWFNILCICSTFGGSLPEVRTVSIKLRMQPRKVIRLLNDLRSAGLLDESNGLISPHNWHGRQYKSDVSTERVQRFRQRKGNVSRNVSETPPETETETEKKEKKEKKDLPADAGVVVKAYAFEDGMIRLNQRDFDAWQKAFSQLDLAAELLSLSKWAESEGKNWFYAVKGALAKRNREVKSAKDRLNAEGGFKWNGIEGVL